MKPDDLDSLSDEALSAVFAVEVAQLNLSPHDEPVSKHPLPTPPLATSVDAVLPWLEKHRRWEVNYVGDSVWKDRAYCTELGGLKAMAATFPRAACIALIRDKRLSP